MQFAELAPHLSALMQALEPILAGFSQGEWNHRAAPEKWSRLEIAGHLVDSACNNHQRFVRALACPSLDWPGYDQDAHVQVQRFAGEDPRTVAALFVAFNRHLAWMFAQFPEDKLATECRVGGAPAMSLEDLALDYVAHLEHHVRQILSGTAAEGAVPSSGMPWPPEDPARQWPA